MVLYFTAFTFTRTQNSPNLFVRNMSAGLPVDQQEHWNRLKVYNQCPPRVNILAQISNCASPKRKDPRGSNISCSDWTLTELFIVMKKLLVHHLLFLVEFFPSVGWPD